MICDVVRNAVRPLSRIPTVNRWNGGISTKESALSYLKALEPAGLFVPGMQTDGFRVDGDTTYLTQLTDLSGNGKDATQTTATAQAYLDGSDAVFSGGQWYYATGLITGDPATIAITYSQDDVLTDGSYNFVFDSVRNDDGYGPYIVRYLNDGYYYAHDASLGNVSGQVLFDYTTGKKISKVFESDIGFTSGGYIGCSRTGINMLNGTISTLAIYNKTLTTAEQSIVSQCLAILGA